MLKVIQPGANLPMSFIADPSAEFRPGMAAQLAVIGNQVMATISNGSAPIGIIDDIRTRAFTNVSWNEIVIVSVSNPVLNNGVLVSPVDLSATLKKANIVPSSFKSTVDCVLNATNGIITFVAGTPLNFDLTGSGTPNAIRAVVSYTYYVANIPGDDSTAGSGRMTVWIHRGFFQTNQFETSVNYPLNANLFVSEIGFLTTRKPSAIHPAVALVTSPPSPINPFMEFVWL